MRSLLVPLRAPTGSLLGVMTLGHKRSELPFNADDRQLLTAVAASVALVIDRRLLGGSGEVTPEGTAADDQPAAQECIRCGRVHPRSAPQCRRCGGDLRDSLLPTHLAGKFAVDRRIGAGGMGVVYKGHDLTLDRAVALKTLPRLSAGEATQLRREARAMASVEHPHLASIYGAESWRGAPVLVLEHLPGGTLADRVAAGEHPDRARRHRGTRHRAGAAPPARPGHAASRREAQQHRLRRRRCPEADGLRPRQAHRGADDLARDARPPQRPVHAAGVDAGTRRGDFHGPAVRRDDTVHVAGSAATAIVPPRRRICGASASRSTKR